MAVALTTQCPYCIEIHSNQGARGRCFGSGDQRGRLPSLLRSVPERQSRMVRIANQIGSMSIWSLGSHGNFWFHQ